MSTDTAVPTRAELVELVAGLLELPPAEVDPDANLLEAGLGSLDMMRLATRWRRAGLGISYKEMAREPSVAAWERHLTTSAAAGPAHGGAR